jgi:hypothetical protein
MTHHIIHLPFVQFQIHCLWAQFIFLGHVVVIALVEQMSKANKPVFAGDAQTNYNQHLARLHKRGEVV